MAVIFRPITDRVKLTIGEVEFLLSPLTYGQKLDIVSTPTKQSGGEKTINIALLTHRIVKYSVKDISGIEMVDGKPYKLVFEKKKFNGLLGEKEEVVLTDECAEELVTGLNLKPSLSLVAGQLINGIPDSIIGEDGKDVEGVSISIVGKCEDAESEKE